MTAKEIIEIFPYAANNGECVGCAYQEFCDKILPGFIKPNKCGGPYYREK